MLKIFGCKSLFPMAAIILLFTSANAFAQSAPLTSTLETWSVTLPSSQVLGLDSILNPSGVGCMNGDFNGSGADSLMCVNESSPDLSQTNGAGGSWPIYATSFMPEKWPENSSPSGFLIFQSTKNPSSGFTMQPVSNGSAAKQQLAIGGQCAVADLTGDGRSDIACFGAQNQGYAQNYPTYPTVWFSTSTSATSPPSFLPPFSNTSYRFPPPLDAQAGPSGSEVPFGPYCTTGHFMAGPGNQILCNIPTWHGAATNNYTIFKYTASYSPAETISESQNSWTGPSIMPRQGSYSGWSNAANFGGDCLTGDFNGDGLTDIACPTGNTTGSAAGSWTIGYSTGNGFKNIPWAPSPINLASPGGGSPGDCTTGDFNGDGKTDIICSYSNNSAADPRFEVYLANANGNGFQPGQVWSIPGVPERVEIFTVFDAATPSPSWLNVFSSVCAVADLNGDGKSDVICYSDNPNDSKEWVYGLSSGSGFSAYTIDSIVPPAVQFLNTAYNASSITGPGTNLAPFAGACTLGDYLGNGLVDILCNPESMTGATSSTYTFSVAILSRTN